MSENDDAEPATDLEGLFDGTAPVGAVHPPARPKPRVWPETTPIAGRTPVLPPVSGESTPD